MYKQTSYTETKLFTLIFQDDLPNTVQVKELLFEGQGLRPRLPDPADGHLHEYLASTSRRQDLSLLTIIPNPITSLQIVIWAREMLAGHIICDVNIYANIKYIVQ